MSIRFVFLFLFFQGVVYAIQFSPVSSWILNASLNDAATGKTYYIWKPVCQGGYAIGDFLTDIDYKSNGDGKPPTDLLFCASDFSRTILAATNFTMKSTFKNLIDNNATWQVVEGSTQPSRFVPGYSILPDSSTPSILIPSTLPTLSIGGFLHKDSLKRTVSNEQKETSYSATITYGTFPNNTCFQQCQTSPRVYRLPSLEFDFIVYNPFEFLGAFTGNATLFIANRTTLSVPFCFTTECVCGPCYNGGQCNQFGVCICPPQWRGPNCSEPVDMCASDMDDCDPLVECISYPGGYNCTPCPQGYEDVYNNGSYCVDIDECRDFGQQNCSQQGLNCTNIPGSFVCVPCPPGYIINSSNSCIPLYCGNGRIDNQTREECDGGYRCLPNCTCAPGFTSTSPPSNNCITACGNGELDRGEECDGGLGCDETCHCKQNLGFFPSQTPSVNCVNSTFAYFDPCQLHNESCALCVDFNCLYCSDSKECINSRPREACKTSCESSSNNTSLSSPSPSSSPESKTSFTIIITLIAIGGALIVGILFLVLLLYLRRKSKLKQRRSNNDEIKFLRTKSSRYGLLNHQGSLISLTKEWTPPSDSNFVKLNKLPVKFSKELDFNLGKNQFRVNEPYIDVIVLTLKEDRKDEVYVEFHPSVNPRYELVIEPQSVVVKKGKEVEVKFTLTVTMTTEVECPIAINLPHEKIHSKMIVNIVSELSPFIDFDELVIDSQKPIGDGGFGTVYRGQYRGTDVAIKILKIQDLPTELLEEFTREIDLMAKLRHKNIIQFLGASCVQGKYAIVTEFIELGSVSSVMKKEKFSYPLKLKIACDAARALNFLHKNKILHRDLKLENLLLVSMSLSAPVNAKLADFGTSRAVSEKASNKYTTGIGTPIYMAPEILKREPYDLSSDIYSFGMMLWALMAEKEPWSQCTQPWEVANLVIEGKREAIPSEWPSEIADLIQRCWAQNPKERPEAKEIYQILQEITSKELEQYNIDDSHLMITTRETPRDNDFNQTQ